MTNGVRLTLGPIFVVIALVATTVVARAGDGLSAGGSDQMLQALDQLLDLFDESATVDLDAAMEACGRLAEMDLNPRQRRLCAIVATQLLRRRAAPVPPQVDRLRGLSASFVVAHEVGDLLSALGDRAAIPHLQDYYLKLAHAGGEGSAFHVERVIRALGGEVPVIERSPQERQWPPDSVLTMDELKGARAGLILQHLQEEGWDTTELRTKSAQAIYELGQLRAQAAMPYLLEQLDQETPFMMRVRAIAALGEIGDPGAVDPLIALLGENRVPQQFDASDDIRREAVRALRGMGAKTALPAVKRCLDDPEPTVRQAAFAAVCDLGGPEDRAAAIEKLRNDPDPEVRQTVERRLHVRGAQPPAD
jgi:hypothetical protein